MIKLKEYVNSDYCLINPWNEEYLVDDPDDLLINIDIYNEEDIEQAIETAKQLQVFEKDYFLITKDLVNEFLQQVEEEGRNVRSFEDFIYDYADNFGMDYFDSQPEAMDLINDFAEQYAKDKSKCNIDLLVGEFNDAQYYYTSGKFVDYLDFSKEVQEYLKEEYPEEYARFKKMQNK